MSLTQEITVDLIPSFMQMPMIYCSQYDDQLRTIIVKIKDGGVAFDVTGYTILIEGTKPDKHGFSYYLTDIGSASGNTVTFIIQLQMCAVPGMTRMEVVLKDGDDRVGTANFMLVVERAGLQDDTDLSTSELAPYIDGAQEACRQAEEAVTHYPKIDGGTWWVWDPQTSAFVDTGCDATGAAGVGIGSVVKTGTSGNVDTYTVYSDEETPQVLGTYTVTNVDPDATYPQLTSGNAQELDSDLYTVNQEPYLLRAVPSGATRERDKIVGGSVVANQLVQNGNFADTTGWGSTVGTTLTASGGVASIAYNEGSKPRLWQELTISAVSPHKYLITVEAKMSEVLDMRIGLATSANGGGNSDIFTVSTSWARINAIVQANGDRAFLFVGIIYQATNTTTASGTFEIRNFQMVDLTQMFGTAVADYLYALGSSTAIAKLRAMGYIDDVYHAYDAGTMKHVSGVSAHVMRDADDNVIATYPLDDSLTLRGVTKIVDGEIVYDGDEYGSDGVVKRRYAYATFDGTEDWVKSTSYPGNYYLSGGLPGGKSGSALTQTNLALTPVAQLSELSTGDMCVLVDGSGTNKNLNIKNTSKATLVEFKAWIASLEVVYELATPTTESADPFVSPQIVDPYGTEEYVTTGIPVGHYTEYPVSQKGKLDSMPNSLFYTENALKATRAYTVNQLISVKGQLYKVLTSIASGATLTVGTNVQAVSLGDIITALLNA